MFVVDKAARAVMDRTQSYTEAAATAIGEARKNESVKESAAEILEWIVDLLAKPGLTAADARAIGRALGDQVDDLADAIAHGTAADHETGD